MRTQKIFCLCFITLLLGSCRTDFNFGCIEPEGDVITQTIEFGEFDEVSTNFDSDVTITEGPIHEVIITAHANIIDRIIEDSSNNGDLDLEINGCSRIRNDERPKIEITMPELTQLQIKGDGTMATNGTFENIPELTLKIEGDGEMNINAAQMEDVIIDIKGDGDIVINGECGRFSASIQGDGNIDAEELISQTTSFRVDGDGEGSFDVRDRFQVDIQGDGKVVAIGSVEKQTLRIQGDGKIFNFGLASLETTIDIQGDGDCEVTVEDNLEVKISGDGKVCYKGNPSLDTDISGGGEINNCN